MLLKIKTEFRTNRAEAERLAQMINDFPNDKLISKVTKKGRLYKIETYREVPDPPKPK